MNPRRNESCIRPIRLGGIACALACAVAAGTCGAARAQRFVVVNGQMLSEPQIKRLEQRGCVAIPSGNYWLRADRVWGYVGDPRPHGRLGEYCGQRHRSLSERGLLYSPGELLR